MYKRPKLKYEEAYRQALDSAMRLAAPNWTPQLFEIEIALGNDGASELLSSLEAIARDAAEPYRQGVQ